MSSGPATTHDGLRIGIFGGTFDPVHVGHLVAAVNVRHDLALDRVLLVVANQPWQKVGVRAVSPAEKRFAVVAAAVEGLPGLEASRIELDRGGTSYTADTVADVAAAHPDAELFLIIGADVARDLDTWERVDEIRGRTRLVVVNRPGAPPPAPLPGWTVDVVEIPNLEVSSTDLRARATAGRPLDFLVPSTAIHAIDDLGLYAGGG
jgi:nicotinate-nucleotide adenylyltransferase